jgi:AbrB family looped-hinge helix DNA binding protein
MSKSIIIAKDGRITIPKELRDQFGWTKGDLLAWQVQGEFAKVNLKQNHTKSLIPSPRA